MSEYTNYYAVESAPMDEIKSKLRKADVLSAIIDHPLIAKPENKWIVVEAPTLMDFTTPRDYSTLRTSVNPWNILKSTFSKIVKIFIEEDQHEWSLTTSLNGKEKIFKFYKKDAQKFSETDRHYLSELFDTPFETLAEYLKVDQVHNFCQTVKLPYLEMEDQDHMADIILKYGKVIFVSQIKD